MLSGLNSPAWPEPTLKYTGLLCLATLSFMKIADDHKFRCVRNDFFVRKQVFVIWKEGISRIRLFYNRQQEFPTNRKTLQIDFSTTYYKNSVR